MRALLPWYPQHPCFRRAAVQAALRVVVMPARDSFSGVPSRKVAVNDHARSAVLDHDYAQEAKWARTAAAEREMVVVDRLVASLAEMVIGCSALLRTGGRALMHQKAWKTG
jgi:hypothetical protein